MTLRVGIAAGLLSGLLLRLSAPGGGLGWLAWVALVPAATVALGSPRSRAGRLAVPLAFAVYLELLLVAALPFGLAKGQFGDVALPLMVGDSPVLAVALLGVPLLGALLYALRFGRPPPEVAHLPRLRGLAMVLAPALAWTALDLVRVKLDPGGLWGPLFLSQHDLPTVRIAGLGGPLLVTLAIVAFNYALALAVSRARISAQAGVAAPAAAAVLLGGSLVAVSSAFQPEAGSRTLVVAAVQPGYDTAEDDRPELRHHRPGTRHLAALDTIRDLAPLTRRAARRGARLIVWPEATFYVDPRRVPAARRSLERLAAETRAALVVPYFARSRRQSAAVPVSPEGGLGPPRPKQRPMWFLGEDNGNKVPPAPVSAGGLRIGTLLGVDNQDPGLGRLLSARGARLLASSTHDWRELATQQRAIASVLAAGTGVPVIRADWRFGSAIYDADGEALADAGTALRRTVLTAEVHPGAAGTPYRRAGDVLGWLALASVCSLVLARIARSRAHKPQPAVAGGVAD